MEQAKLFGCFLANERNEGWGPFAIGDKCLQCPIRSGGRYGEVVLPLPPMHGCRFSLEEEIPSTVTIVYQGFEGTRAMQ